MTRPGWAGASLEATYLKNLGILTMTSKKYEKMTV
jgi:hypothetical protein